MEKNFKIKVELQDIDNVFNVYNNHILSNEFGKYLYDSCALISSDRKISIVINTKFEITEAEKSKIKSTIIDNFNSYLKKEKFLQKHRNIKKIILLLVGLILIMLTEVLKDLYIVEEILLISGWVAIWEVIYDILFVDIKNEHNIKHLKQLSKSKIEFIKE